VRANPFVVIHLCLLVALAVPLVTMATPWQAANSPAGPYFIDSLKYGPWIAAGWAVIAVITTAVFIWFERIRSNQPAQVAFLDAIATSLPAAFGWSVALQVLSWPIFSSAKDVILSILYPTSVSVLFLGAFSGAAVALLPRFRVTFFALAAVAAGSAAYFMNLILTP
jgi:hypothetical protein